jgi:hypothetical protein
MSRSPRPFIALPSQADNSGSHAATADQQQAATSQLTSPTRRRRNQLSTTRWATSHARWWLACAWLSQTKPMDTLQRPARRKRPLARHFTMLRIARKHPRMFAGLTVPPSKAARHD